jgi:hypothetical protein
MRCLAERGNVRASLPQPPGTNAMKASNTNGAFTELLRIIRYYSDLFLPVKMSATLH